MVTCEHGVIRENLNIDFNEVFLLMIVSARVIGNIKKNQCL